MSAPPRASHVQQQLQQQQQQQQQSTVIVQNISAKAERQDLITMFQVSARVRVARVRVALVRAHATPCMSLTPPSPGCSATDT